MSNMLQLWNTKRQLSNLNNDHRNFVCYQRESSAFYLSVCFNFCAIPTGNLLHGAIVWTIVHLTVSVETLRNLLRFAEITFLPAKRNPKHDGLWMCIAINHPIGFSLEHLEFLLNMPNENSNFRAKKKHIFASHPSEQWEVRELLCASRRSL